ncbi:hypothetical protein BaRGS_00025893 [Batillaria attramentaria]|uniref:Uncharacterized protein n=1 Tax=Batillaria attramentaria TaxID=370345 RepID=A0ABD0K7D2_9CAEN
MLQQPGDGPKGLPAKKATLERRALTSTSLKTQGWMANALESGPGLRARSELCTENTGRYDTTQDTKYWSNSQDKHTCKRHKQHTAQDQRTADSAAAVLYSRGTKKGKNRRVVTV